MRISAKECLFNSSILILCRAVWESFCCLYALQIQSGLAKALAWLLLHLYWTSSHFADNFYNQTTTIFPFSDLSNLEEYSDNCLQCYNIAQPSPYAALSDETIKIPVVPVGLMALCKSFERTHGQLCNHWKVENDHITDIKH